MLFYKSLIDNVNDLSIFKLYPNLISGIVQVITSCFINCTFLYNFLLWRKIWIYWEYNNFCNFTDTKWISRFQKYRFVGEIQIFGETGFVRFALMKRIIFSFYSNSADSHFNLSSYASILARNSIFFNLCFCSKIINFRVVLRRLLSMLSAYALIRGLA